MVLSFTIDISPVPNLSYPRGLGLKASSLVFLVLAVANAPSKRDSPHQGAARSHRTPRHHLSFLLKWMSCCGKQEGHRTCPGQDGHHIVIVKTIRLTEMNSLCPPGCIRIVLETDLHESAFLRGSKCRTLPDLTCFRAFSGGDLQPQGLRWRFFVNLSSPSLWRRFRVEPRMTHLAGDSGLAPE